MKINDNLYGVLNGERKFFLDSDIFEKTDNITSGINAAEKFAGNPVIFSHDPAVQPVLYGSVMHDDDAGFRIWYSTCGDKTGRVYVFHEISDDGIKWRKPRYEIIKYGGMDSHAVFGAQQVPHISEMNTVLFDPHDRDPGRRYKMIFKYREPGMPSPYKNSILQNHQQLFDALSRQGKTGLVETYHRIINDSLFLDTQRRAIGTAFSSDGIKWTPVNPLAIPEIGDISHLTWDPYRKRYLIYARDFFLPEDIHEKYKGEDWYQNNFWGRAVRLYESEDFSHWHAGDIVMHADMADLPGDEIYSMAVFPYDGLYLALIQIYHGYPGNNTLDIQLAISHDGVEWKRLGDRKPFIPLGGIGDWDRFNNSMASAPVVLEDEIRFYYAGRSYRHKPFTGPDSGPLRSAIGFATVKRDRFVWAGAGYASGAITTKPLLVKGSTMHLNAACRHGAVIVRLLDENDRLIDGLESKPVCADSLDIVVSWPEDALFKLDKSRPVRIQFEFINAKAYSFWIN